MVAMNAEEVEDETVSRPKDEWLDYYLLSKEGTLRDVVSVVTKEIVSTEARKRSRKAVDQRSFELCADCVLANMSYVFLKYGFEHPIVVSRKLSECDLNTNESMPQRTFVRCLDRLEACGYISQCVGIGSKVHTTIISTQKLHSLIIEHGVDFSCFREFDTRPLVVLRRRAPARAGRKAKKSSVNFYHTHETSVIHDHVSKINRFLSKANIDYINDANSDVRVSPYDRSLVRYFSILGHQGIRFDQGGRLFGRAFWMNMKSDLRQGIRIDGEPVADLDFSNLGPRIAYHLAGHEAPEGDLYDLSGLLPGYDHSDNAQRKAIKRAFASCLNGGRGGKRGNKPKGEKPGTTGILDPLPKGINAAKIRKALVAKHPVLEPFFDPREVPVGFTIMFLESQILLCALEKLMALGVVALPQHDGLMVARSNAGIAQEALQAASREVLGVTIPAELKAVYGPPVESEGLLAA